MNVLVMVGSLRAGSYNDQFADAAIRALPDDVAATRFSRLHELPHFNEDLEGEVPATVRILRDEVAEADALIVVTPEYNGAMSSVVKNAIDWVSRPRAAAAIAGKPTLVLAATQAPRDAIWARENAIRVLTVAGAAPLERSIGIADAYKHLAGGRLTDPTIAAELEAGLSELLATQLASA